MNKPHLLPTRQRWSLPRGRVLLRALRADPTQEYLVYIPINATVGASVLVSLHGITRNAAEQAKVSAAYCEPHGIILVVPVFSSDIHADYQRLGRQGRGIRADLAVNRVLEEVASLSGADVIQNYLLGFSGGAQFAHRYLMAHPHRVRAALIVAAGWYTFPDTNQRFPYGIRHTRALRGVNFNPEEFLRVPIAVVVGEHDVGTSNVRRTERVDSQQGTTRRERARNWVVAMRRAAQKYGLDPQAALYEIPDVDHSFAVLSNRAEFRVVLSAMLEGDVGAAEALAVSVCEDVDSAVES